MIISLIAALDEAGGIGFKGRLPWHLSQDLKRFKNITLGHHLILGRKTFQAIGGPLPGRQMIVLSRDPDFQAEGCLICPDLDQALELAEVSGEGEVFVIGGGEVYREALPLADRLYLTFVEVSSEADTFFPPLDEEDWSLSCLEEYPADGSSPIGHTFKILERKIAGV
jgi:dihydrofolate reductase